MNSLLTYNGFVTISKMCGHNKRIELFSGHNSGDDNLFKLITKFLAHGRISEDELPSLIDIKNNGISVLKNPLTITYNYNKDIYYQTLLDSVLYNSNFTTDPSTTTASYYDVVLTDMQSEVLASIQIPVEVFYRLQTGMQLLITWKLQISNNGE